MRKPEGQSSSKPQVWAGTLQQSSRGTSSGVTSGDVDWRSRSTTIRTGQHMHDIRQDCINLAGLGHRLSHQHLNRLRRLTRLDSLHRLGPPRHLVHGTRSIKGGGSEVQGARAPVPLNRPISASTSSTSNASRAGTREDRDTAVSIPKVIRDADRFAAGYNTHHRLLHPFRLLLFTRSLRTRHIYSTRRGCVLQHCPSIPSLRFPKTTAQHLSPAKREGFLSLSS